MDQVAEYRVRTADQTVVEAQRLLDEGLPFRAHEVLEAAWKAADDGTRELWRALAQLAVGLTHAQRGNVRGAVALLRRGAEGVERWVGEAPAGLEPAALAAHAAELARRLEKSGCTGLDAGDLRLRLRPTPR